MTGADQDVHHHVPTHAHARARTVARRRDIATFSREVMNPTRFRRPKTTHLASLNGLRHSKPALLLTAVRFFPLGPFADKNRKKFGQFVLLSQHQQVIQSSSALLLMIPWFLRLRATSSFKHALSRERSLLSVQLKQHDALLPLIALAENPMVAQNAQAPVVRKYGCEAGE